MFECVCECVCVRVCVCVRACVFEDKFDRSLSSFATHEMDVVPLKTPNDPRTL